MRITLYGIKNCSTMKKAFDQLTELGISYEFHDYKKQGIDKATLSHWVEQVGIDKVINTNGTTYRQLSDEKKSQARADTQFAITLMTEQPSLIKRPILIKGDTILVGFNESEYQNLA